MQLSHVRKDQLAKELAQTAKREAGNDSSRVKNSKNVMFILQRLNNLIKLRNPPKLKQLHQRLLKAESNLKRPHLRQ
jgi:hypothetical protein